MNSEPNKSKNPTQFAGRLMFAIAWVLFMALIGLIYQTWHSERLNPNINFHSHITSSGVREIVLKRNRNNAYRVQGTINQQTVHFMVDTGATSVAIPMSLAKKLQLSIGPEITVMTASGRVRGNLTRVESLSIGSIYLNDLSATLIPNKHDTTVLLGMSALKQLEFSQSHDQLILKQRPN